MKEESPPKSLKCHTHFLWDFPKGLCLHPYKSSELGLQPWISLLDRHTVAADWGAPPAPCTPPLCSV